MMPTEQEFKKTIRTLQLEIKEHERLQQKLLKDNEMLRSVAEGTTDAIFVKDLKGRYQLVNPACARLFGRTVDDVIDKLDDDLFLPENARQIVENDNEVISANKPKLYEDTFEIDGQTRVFQSLKAPWISGGRIVGLIGISRDITDRKNAEIRLQDEHDRLEKKVLERTADLEKVNQELNYSNEKLQSTVQELEQFNRANSALNFFADLLHNCETLEEAHTAIKKFDLDIFPGESVKLYILSNSSNLLEEVASWGNSHSEKSAFATDDCWAIRTGKPHLEKDTSTGQLCRHVTNSPADGGYLCIPMIAQGKTLGLLHLQFDQYGHHSVAERKSSMESLERWAIGVAEHLALALANLHLRETLRNEAMHDPLTGLFSRRHMESALELEVNRFIRNHRALGLIMTDIDFFKRINDSYGHQAGDEVLRALGEFLKKEIRPGDMACRYGGEEFLLILPEASLEAIRDRAEQLRVKVKDLDIAYGNKKIGITLSLGVAALPDHGQTVKDLLKAADSALYRAKESGRDQVVVSQQAI